MSAYQGLPVIEDESLRLEADRIIERIRKEIVSVEIPREPQNRHPLMIKYEECREANKLSHPRDTRWWRKFEDKHEILDIEVREDLEHRAVRIMNSLLYLLEALGFEIRISEHIHGAYHTEAYMFNQPIAFGLNNESYYLHLRAWGLPPREARSVWKDGKKRIVEENLADFACSLVYGTALKAVSSQAS